MPKTYRDTYIMVLAQKHTYWSQWVKKPPNTFGHLDEETKNMEKDTLFNNSAGKTGDSKAWWNPDLYLTHTTKTKSKEIEN